MSHHLPILLRLSSKSLVLNNGREERPTVFWGGRRLLCQYVRGPKKKEPSAVNGFSDYSRKMRYRCFPLFFSPMSSFFFFANKTHDSVWEEVGGEVGARSEEKKRRKNMCSRRRRSRKIGRERVGGGAHQIFVAHSDAHTLGFSTRGRRQLLPISRQNRKKRKTNGRRGEGNGCWVSEKKEGPRKLLQCNGVFS